MTTLRALALISALAIAGPLAAHAQWPSPGQTSTQTSPFPPAQGQTATQSNPFPPPPGQSAPPPQQQSSPFPGPPSQQQSPFPAAPGQASQSPQGGSPFPPPGGGASRGNICEQFPALRSQAEQDATAIKAASERKATREEICAGFVKFSGSEGRMVKFLETNRAACGVPPDAIKQVKTQHARTLQIRKNVCATGGPSGPPRAPSLSDALGGPVLPDDKPKPGRGTFDTLTGNALGR